MSSTDQPAPGEGQASKVKVTLELFDAHAPGIVAFLRSLPTRGETAFIRGLIYQWMLDNLGAEDYAERLLAVLNGPGGRAMFSLPNHSSPLRAQTLSMPSKAPRRRAAASTPTLAAPNSRAAVMRRMPDESPAPQVGLGRAAPPRMPEMSSSLRPAEPAVYRAAPIAVPHPPEADVSATPVDPGGELNPFDDLF